MSRPRPDLRTLRRSQAGPRARRCPDVARSVAIIMDGNGRWARARGLPVAAGHRAGHAGAAAHGRGGDRPRRRVALRLRVLDRELVAAAPTRSRTCMDLFAETIERELPDLRRAGRAHALHRPARPRLADALRREDGRARARHRRQRARSQLWIAFDYGGRAEIVEAARRLVERRRRPRATSTRTRSRAALRARHARARPRSSAPRASSGISNFLLWQLAYTELVFCDTLWPDFGERDLRAGARRVRRPPPPLRRPVSAAPRRASHRRRAALPIVARRRRTWAAGSCSRSRWSRRSRAARVLPPGARRCGRSCSRATAARSARMLGAQLGGVGWMLARLPRHAPARVRASRRSSDARQSTTVSVATTVARRGLDRARARAPRSCSATCPTSTAGSRSSPSCCTCSRPTPSPTSAGALVGRHSWRR